jgi:hypothetical protein
LKAKPASAERYGNPRNEKEPHDIYQLSQSYHARSEKGRGMHLSTLVEDS